MSRILKQLQRSRKLRFELLEERRVFTSIPFGAADSDTGEFLLGRIAVTAVLLESNGQIDPSSENWDVAHRDQVLANLDTGLEWWSQLLDSQSSVHQLEWVVDSTYANNPVATKYEPINRVSNDYVLWVTEFLQGVGFNQSSSLETNMRAFNHDQRVKHDANWAYTVFIVNSENDQEGTFAPGGSFNRAFAFAGGLFFVTPSTRPASTYAHETGHMFWARDEYSGGSNYNQRRGYYDTQNLNATDLNPDPNFQQATSIMSAGSLLDSAFAQVVSPPSTLAMLGWQDTDADGVFDVLDVPLELEGTGRWDASTGQYRFQGSARVQTLANRNSSGLQNDITLNRVSRIEYRLDGGSWLTASTPDAYAVDLDLVIPMPSSTQSIQLRAIDAATDMTSNVFTGSTLSQPDSVNQVGIQGFVFGDQDRDSQWDAPESGLSGWTIRLVDSQGLSVLTQQVVEPDDRTLGPIASGAYPNVNLSAVGSDTDGKIGVFEDTHATTGSRVFQPFSIATQSYAPIWRGELRKLNAAFSEPLSAIEVDVVGAEVNSIGRLEAYAEDGTLLERRTTERLAVGQSARLSIIRENAEIASIVIKGHQDTAIKIDPLRLGPSSSFLTDSAGRYVLAGLSPGNYRLQTLAPNASTGLIQDVTLAQGQTLTHVDFSSTQSPWHNSTFVQDVNRDGVVTPIDILLVINLINEFGSTELAGSSIAFEPRVDTSNDGNLTGLDALIVVNYINEHTDFGSGGEGEDSRFDRLQDLSLGDESLLDLAWYDPSIENQVGREGRLLGRRRS